MLSGQLDCRPAVGRLGHHLETVALEQSAHALAQHDVIVGQHYP